MTTPTIPLGAAYLKLSLGSGASNSNKNNSQSQGATILKPLTRGPVHDVARSTAETSLTAVDVASPGRKERLQNSKRIIETTLKNLVDYSLVKDSQQAKIFNTISIDNLKNDKDLHENSINIKCQELSDIFIGENEPILLYQNSQQALNTIAHARENHR